MCNKTGLFWTLLLLELLFPAVVLSQDNTPPVPSTPAFSILGFEPASVMRPTSVKDLSTDLLNTFDKEGKLLTNLGLEVAPYWLQSRPTLTKEQYLHPNPGQTFLQTLLVSAATVKDTITGNNNLGTGIRFKLYNGQPTAAYSEKLKELEQFATTVSAITAARGQVGSSITSRNGAISTITSTMQAAGISDTWIRSLERIARERAQYFDDSNAGVTAFIEDLNKTLDDANRPLKEKVSELDKTRVGFILEVAGATSFVPSARDGALERTGVWLTASYSGEKSIGDAFNLSMRYLLNSRDTVVANYDLGLSYVKKMQKFTLSVEGMLRWYEAEFFDLNLNQERITRVEKDFTYRIAAQSAYMINEDISINLSIGKDFKSPSFDTGGFFSIFGVNYAIFKNPSVKLEQ